MAKAIESSNSEEETDVTAAVGVEHYLLAWSHLVPVDDPTTWATQHLGRRSRVHAPFSRGRAYFMCVLQTQNRNSRATRIQSVVSESA